MMTLEDLSFINWLTISAGLILILGPGIAVLSFYSHKIKFDFTFILALSVLFSISFWLILLVWFQLFSIRLGLLSFSLISFAGWGIGGYRIRILIRNRMTAWSFAAILPRLLLYGVAAAAFFLALWNSRHFVTGLGSDSYHHTLIAQMIADVGKIPLNYLPYAPLVSFSYHFGYHATIALINWVSNVPVRLLVVLSGPILIGLSAFTTGILTEKLVKSQYAAVMAAAVAGLIVQFPTFMLNWGRYPQLFGLGLLPILIILFIEWLDGDLKATEFPVLGFTACGLALVHYRVALMAGVAIIVLVFVNQGSWKIHKWGFSVVRKFLPIAVTAFLLISPWVWRVYSSHKLGYPVNFPTADPSFYSFARTGIDLKTYPTGIPVLILAAFAVIAGLLRKDKAILFVSTWSLLLILLAQPLFAGTFMDFVSVTISFYLPVAVAVGWLFAKLLQTRSDRFEQIRRAIAAAGAVSIILWGAFSVKSYYAPLAGYVTRNDIAALEWIRENTPEDAVFMVNTIHFSFNDQYVIGSDAGYWIPLLAGRQTVTVPMVYPTERLARADVFKNLVTMDKLSGEFNSNQALDQMKQLGITYIYLGDVDNPAHNQMVASSPELVSIYQNGNSNIYKIVITK